MSPAAEEARRRSRLHSIARICVLVALLAYVAFIFVEVRNDPDDTLCSTFSAYYDDHVGTADRTSPEWVKAHDLRVACLDATTP